MKSRLGGGGGGGGPEEKGDGAIPKIQGGGNTALVFASDVCHR